MKLKLVPENNFFLDNIACDKKCQLREYFCNIKRNFRYRGISKQHKIVHTKNKKCKCKIRYCRLCGLLFPENKTAVDRIITYGTDYARRHICQQYISCCTILSRLSCLMESYNRNLNGSLKMADRQIQNHMLHYK